MLLPWSKPLILTIAAHSIALKDSNSKVHLLSKQTTDFANIPNVLEKVKALFKRQSVEIILSNHFVRFLALPWQAHIVQLQDWQAIAQHAFKKEFGAMANDWKVAVHLYGFGQPILATAMDKSAIHHLNEVAMLMDFKIQSIIPLLNKCWSQHLTEKDWLLIVEPQRLLLAQMQACICNQMVVDMPPSGQEQQHATQLVQRSLMQTPETLRPSRVLTYVTSEIQENWQKNGDSIIKLVNPVVNNQPHAVWMANFLDDKF